MGISDLVRFTPIWSDLVIRVTGGARVCTSSLRYVGVAVVRTQIVWLDLFIYFI